MINGNLLVKQTGVSVCKLNSKNVPQRAVTYNYVAGFSDKKGDFEITSFFDKFGRLLKISSLYKFNHNISKMVNNYSKLGRVVYSYNEINGKVARFSKKTLYPDNFFTEEIIEPCVDYDTHRIGFLKPKCNPRIISYQTCWNGEKPVLNYQNIDTELNIDKGIELLPLIVSNSSSKRIEHLAEYRMRDEGIDDITPPVIPISQKELVNKSEAIRDYFEQTGKVSGVTDSVSGEVYIVIDNKDNAELIDTVAHEYQHVKDASNILRLDDCKKLARTSFESFSLRRGIIEKNHPEYSILQKMLAERNIYNESCFLGKHDDMISEQRAIQKGKEQKKMFFELINTIKLFLMR